MSEHAIRLLNDTPVPMRDGVRLSADVYLPRDHGRWPVILIRTPYGNQNQFVEASFFASRGYAVVVQDCRGRHDSEGDFEPWTIEIDDGADTVEWCGTQAWSNGHVGMIGGSHLGNVQWWAAQTPSPYLKTIVPFSAVCDMFLYGMNYRGGAFKLHGNLVWATMVHGRTMQPSMLSTASTGSVSEASAQVECSPFDWPALFRHLPLRTADDEAVGHPIEFYRDWLQHSSWDEHWKRFTNVGRYERFDLPILMIGGWFDVHVVSTIANLEGLQAAGHGKHGLVIGPWGHGPAADIGEVDLGPEAEGDFRALQLRWLDYHLKGIDNGVDRDPRLRLFTLGTNMWRDASEWPLPGTRWTKLHLRAGGALTEEMPEGEEVPVTFIYDPGDPVPTLSPNPWDDRQLDHRPHEQRPDVLVYTTRPLPADVEVTGPVQAVLYASSSAVDTDWTVRLLDVYPDGRSINVCDGILRARFQDPPAIRTGVPSPGQFERPQLLEPGRIYRFTIEVGATSIVFLRGHRVRVHVSSSNFPRFDRNLNNGTPLGESDQPVVATQTIYHNAEQPSHIELPVIR
jgi:putative CocE/NonD family hydrolase